MSTDTKRADSATFGSVPPSPMKAMAKLRGWRVLRSMRTAIYLLLTLVTATLIPTMVPQRSINPQGVADWFEKYPTLSQVLDRLRFFDVFDAPWYVAIYGSLLFVLILCLIPRTRAYIAQVRRSTATPREGTLPNLANETEWHTDLEPEEAAAAVRRELRRRRFRSGRANGIGQFVAEKGASREGGSLAFHWSFFVLLAGLFVTRAFGFTGFAVVVEGEQWVEAPINIDRYQGPFFGEDSVHRRFAIALDSFDVRFRENGSAADFVSSVRVLDGPPDNRKEVERKEIRVNSPLDYRGVKLYQASFGWATRVVVKDAAGEVVYDDFVALQAQGPRNSWTGAVKIPQLRPQAGLELFFLPSAVVVSPEQAASFDDDLGAGVRVAAKPGPPTADDPALLFREYRGALGLDRPQNVNELDRSQLGRPTDGGIVQLDGDPFTLEDGLTVEFPELRHYTVFQVKRDPGLWLVLIAASMILLGLVPALYVSRRRLWIWVRPDMTAEGRTLVTCGGLAYQRKQAFPAEFASLSERLRRRVPPSGEPLAPDVEAEHTSGSPRG